MYLYINVGQHNFAWCLNLLLGPLSSQKSGDSSCLRAGLQHMNHKCGNVHRMIKDVKKRLNVSQMTDASSDAVVVCYKIV